MAVTNTISTLDGFFKHTYAEQLNNLVPLVGRIYQATNFKEKLGKEYNQPVVLSNESGVTYAASAAGAFLLPPSFAGKSSNKTLTPILAKWHAIPDPIMPEPRTTAFLILNDMVKHLCGLKLQNYGINI